MTAMTCDPETHKFLAFFRPEVLAQYREQPDKYDYRTDDFEGRLAGILAELGLLESPDIILIDARRDNKPSASKA